MKRISFSVVAPFVLGLSLCVCGSASAQGGHAQPDTGGGPPGGGTAGEVVGQATAAYLQPSYSSTNSPYATARMTQLPNSDNEGQTSGDAEDDAVDYCDSTTDQNAGSFDYTTTLTLSNPVPSSTTITWSVSLAVSGYINYNKGNAYSMSTLGGSGPYDSCSMPAGPSSYGSNPGDGGAVGESTPMMGNTSGTLTGAASGFSAVFN